MYTYVYTIKKNIDNTAFALWIAKLERAFFITDCNRQVTRAAIQIIKFQRAFQTCEKTVCDTHPCSRTCMKKTKEKERDMGYEKDKKKKDLGKSHKQSYGEANLGNDLGNRLPDSLVVEANRVSILNPDGRKISRDHCTDSFTVSLCHWPYHRNPPLDRGVIIASSRRSNPED